MRKLTPKMKDYLDEYAQRHKCSVYEVVLVARFITDETFGQVEKRMGQASRDLDRASRGRGPDGEHPRKYARLPGSVKIDCISQPGLRRNHGKPRRVRK